MESYLLDIYSELNEDSEFAILLRALYLGCPYEVIIQIIKYLEFYSAFKNDNQMNAEIDRKREEISVLLKIYDY